MERSIQSAPVQYGWYSPLRGAIKINSDSAVRGTHSFLEIMARTEDGDIIEAHSFKVSTFNPMVAELLAVKEAMLLSLNNDSNHIVYESDAKNIIDCLNGGNIKMLHWTMEPVFKEILNLQFFYEH